MDGMVQADVSPAHDLPFFDPPARERHIAMGFRLPDGAILALRGTSALDGSGRSSVQLNRLRPGETAWPAQTGLGIDVPLAAALSDVLRPVLVDSDAAGGFTVAWPLDHGGCAMMTGQGVAPFAGWSQGLATAFAAGEGLLALALEPDPATGAADIRVADRAAAAIWRAPVEGGLPCADSEMVTALAVFSGQVYAAKSNPRAGFSLWRAPVAGALSWEPVIEIGAWRYGASPHVSAMAVIGDRLFLAAAGADRMQLLLGDEHPELLAVRADGTWALISGQQRFTPKGQLLPETVFGPGTPTFAGMSVGGIEPAEDGGLQVWLKPLEPQRQNVLVLDWTPQRGTWQLARKLPVGDMDVLSVVAGRNGPCLVTASSEGGFTVADGQPHGPLTAMPA